MIGEGGVPSSISLVTGEGEKMVQIEVQEIASKLVCNSWQRSRRGPVAGAFAMVFDKMHRGMSDLSIASEGSMAVRRTYMLIAAGNVG